MTGSVPAGCCPVSGSRRNLLWRGGGPLTGDGLWCRPAGVIVVDAVAAGGVAAGVIMTGALAARAVAAGVAGTAQHRGDGGEHRERGGDQKHYRQALVERPGNQFGEELPA